MIIGSVVRNDLDTVDAKLTELSQTQAALDVEIGEWLLAAERIQLHAKFGYASIFEYAARKFGWEPRAVFERLRGARKLETLDVEAEWLEIVRGLTVREVERLVADHKKNARPNDKKDENVCHRGPERVPATTAERIACDATIVPATVDGKIVEKASQSIPPGIRRQVIVEARGCCEVPSCLKRYLEVHHRTFRSDGGTHELRFLVAICHLCRYRHNQHYADPGFMPRSPVAPEASAISYAA